MTVLRMLIFCLRLAGEKVSNLHCCLAFCSVVSFYIFYLRDEISWMPRYAYGSFCVRMGKVFIL